MLAVPEPGVCVHCCERTPRTWRWLLVKLLWPPLSPGHEFSTMNACLGLRGRQRSLTAAAKHHVGICCCEHPPQARPQLESSRSAHSRVWGRCPPQQTPAISLGGAAAAASTVGASCHGHVRRAAPPPWSTACTPKALEPPLPLMAHLNGRGLLDLPRNKWVVWKLPPVLAQSS